MNGELDFDDILYFPEEIVTEKVENDILVISVTTANWLVLRNELQLILLNKLRNRLTIGQIVEELESEEEVNSFKSLLAAIFARKFAGVGALSAKEYLEGYKMLNIYITNACNLRCKHCFMKSGSKLQCELSLENWLGILSDFKVSGGVSVTFSGGEPLMFKEFAAILKYAHNIGLNTTVLSNGLLWSKCMIEDLASYIDEIQFSIDGVNEDTNAIVRGKGHFKKVVDTVVEFSRIGVKTSVATTFTYENLNDDTDTKYKELVSAIKNSTSNEVFFKLSKKLLSGREIGLTAEENEKYSKRIKEIEQFVNKNADYENFMAGHTPNLIAVNCGFGGISISADGYVSFCNRIYEVENYGHILEHPISYFIEKGKEIHIRTSVDNVEPCSKCALRYICDGGCRIDDFDFAGNLQFAPKPYRQISCTEQKKHKFMKRMIDSYNYLYDFDE
jgi:radical SAM protein with 4Fe4S-binding SPASM domain